MQFADVPPSGPDILRLRYCDLQLSVGVASQPLRVYLNRLPTLDIQQIDNVEIEEVKRLSLFSLSTSTRRLLLKQNLVTTTPIITFSLYDPDRESDYNNVQLDIVSDGQNGFVQNR